MSRRVLIAVGAGGVGKTTTAAALGVAAARRGQARAVPDDRPGEATGRVARARDDVCRGAGDRAGALRAGGRAAEGVAHRDDARHEAHLRRAGREVLVDARAGAAAAGQQALPVRVDVARGHAGVHGDGEARRRAARPAVRPHHPGHAAHRERARLPRRARAACGCDRLGGDALVRPGVRVDGQALAEPAGPVRGRGAARPREDHRRRLPRGDGRVHLGAQRPVRRLQAAREDRRGVAAVARSDLRARHEPGADEHPGGPLLQRAPGPGADAARRLRGEPLPPAPAARRAASGRAGRRRGHRGPRAEARGRRPGPHRARPRRRRAARGPGRPPRARARRASWRQGAHRPRPRAPRRRARPARASRRSARR